MKDRNELADEILRHVDGIERPVIVEVGVEVGKLSRTLLHRRKDLTLIMVDNWLEMDRQPIGYVQTGDPSAKKTLDEQIARRLEALEVSETYGKRAIVIEDDSVHAARGLDDRSVDLVFLDADHSFSGVLNDLTAWRLKPKQGGWIGGHDYANPTTQQDMTGVKQAVDGYFGRERVHLGVEFSWFVGV